MTVGRIRPSLGALAWRFLLVGATSFGGGLTGHLRRALVEDRSWLTEDEFLEGLSIAQAVPGPNAINLSIYAGWRLRGGAGALAAAAAVMLVPLAFVSVPGGPAEPPCRMRPVSCARSARSASG